MVAKEIPSEKYEEIKDKTIGEIQELDNERISLIFLSYKDTSSLKIGHKVDVWVEVVLMNHILLKLEQKK
ncbi:hypothetical protein AN959_09230 [Psychrobacillus sp. FJAT-21963]|nr:hypothetical protein AN959_09230 [Psychrobacillus sp. FJAT-21963]